MGSGICSLRDGVCTSDRAFSMRGDVLLGGNAVLLCIGPADPVDTALYTPSVVLSSVPLDMFHPSRHELRSLTNTNLWTTSSELFWATWRYMILKCYPSRVIPTNRLLPSLVLPPRHHMAVGGRGIGPSRWRRSCCRLLASTGDDGSLLAAGIGPSRGGPSQLPLTAAPHSDWIT